MFTDGEGHAALQTLSIFYRRLLARDIYSRQDYRYLDSSSAIEHLAVDRRLEFEPRASEVSGDGNELIVTLDIESVENRFWLAAKSNGVIKIYDSYSPPKAILTHRKTVSSYRPFPLGYEPTSEELLEAIDHLKILPPIEPVLTTRMTPLKSSKTSRILTCCKFIANEKSGILTSSLDGKMSVWDTERISSRDGRLLKPLLEVESFKSPICHFSSHGEHVSHNVTMLGSCLVEQLKPHNLIACCSLDKAAALRLLDLRAGGFVSCLQGERSSVSAGSGVVSSSWSPRNSSIIVSGELNGSARCWDIRKAGGRNVFNFDMSFVDWNFVRGECNETAASRLDILRQAMSSRSSMPDSLLSPDAPEAATSLVEESSPPLTAEAQYHKLGFATESELWNFIRGNGTGSQQGSLLSLRQKRRRNFEAMRKEPSKKERFGAKNYTKEQDNKPEEFSMGSSGSAKQMAHRMAVTNFNFVGGGSYLLSSTLGNLGHAKSLATHDHVRLWDAESGKACPVSFVIPPESLNVDPSSESSSAFAKCGLKILPTSFEVIDCGKGREVLCSGVNHGMALHDVFSGRLLKYVKTSSAGKNLNQIKASRAISHIADLGGSLIAAESSGRIVSWRADFQEERTETESEESPRIPGSLPFGIELLSRRLRGFF